MDIRSYIRLIENFSITQDVISEVIRIKIKEWLLDDVSSVKEISNGYCGDFADSVWRALGCPPDDILYFSSCYVDGSGHTWLTFQGKH